MLVETAKSTLGSVVQVYYEQSEKLAEKIPWNKKERISLSAAAVLTFVAWRLYKRTTRKTTNHIDPALQAPMLKGGIPVFGHLFEIHSNPTKFLDNARDLMGPVFGINMPGHGNVVVVTGKYIEEVAKSPRKFNFALGMQKLIPYERVVALSYQHKFIAEVPSPRAKNPVIYSVKHNFKEDKIGVFSERVQIALKSGMDSLFDIKKGESRVVNTWDTLTVLISSISCPCFAGSKVGYNKELNVRMASFTQKVIRAGAVVTLLPEWASNFIVSRFLSVEKEMDLIMKLLVPELEKIRDGVEGADDEVTFTSMALTLPTEDGSQRSVKNAAYFFNAIALASIHTTSHFTSFALHELSCRPELVKDLRDELATLTERTPETVSKLPLMDSFFRESLRHNGDFLGLRHLALNDTTISSGHVIPKGSLVVCAVDQMHRDERYVPDYQVTGNARPTLPLDQFDAYRFYGKDVTSTTLGVEYLAFGLGAHACPGRFFAANEIKYVISEMISRFNIRTKSGKRATDNVLFGMARFPPLEPLIFERV